MLDTVGLGFLARAPDPAGRLPGDQANRAWRLMAGGPSADDMQLSRATLNGELVQLTWHASPPHGSGADDGEGYLVARASLPRLMYGSNYLELEPADVLTAFDRLVMLAARAAGVPEPAPEAVHLARLDLVRNRQLGSREAVQWQLQQLAEGGRAIMPGRWKFAMHKSRSLRGALTAQWVQHDRSLIAYDKEAESKRREARGLVRYEIRHQGHGVARHLGGLRRLSEVTPVQLESYLQQYLQLVPEFAPGETLEARTVRAAVDLWGARRGAGRAMRLLGYLYMAHQGEVPTVPARTARYYCAQIRQLAQHMGTAGQELVAGVDAVERGGTGQLAGAVVAHREVAAAADRDPDTTEGDE